MTFSSCFDLRGHFAITFPSRFDLGGRFAITFSAPFWFYTHSACIPSEFASTGPAPRRMRPSHRRAPCSTQQAERCARQP